MTLRRRSNESLITEGRTYAKIKPHNPKCMCGLCVYNDLVTARTALKCNCAEPEWVHFSSVNLFPVGTFCALCGLLHYTSLANNTYECEGCGKWCSYDFRQFLPIKDYDPNNRITLPLPNTLCRRCDVPAPNLPSGVRRRFTIN